MVSSISTERLNLSRNGRRIGLLLETLYASGEGYFIRAEPFDIDALRVIRSISGSASGNLMSAHGLLIAPCAGISARQTQATASFKVKLIKQILENCG